jgi:hypothetical protein
MITRGSKFFYGAAAFGLVAAFVYGFITNAADQGGIVSVMTGGGGIVDSVVGPLTLGWKGGVGEHLGYTVLLGFAGLMGAIGGFHTAFRDGDAEATAQVSHMTSAPPVSVPFGLSPWPFLTAVSVIMVMVGLAMSSVVFVIGVIGLIVAGFEWTVRSWSERATGDPALNRELRNRFMLPLEVPVGAVLVGGIVIFSVSRILLAINKTAAAYLIIVLATVVFVAAIVIANRPQLKRSILVGTGVVFAVLIIGGGIAGGIAGEHPLEEHEGEHKGKKEGAAAVVHTAAVLTDNEVVRG